MSALWTDITILIPALAAALAVLSCMWTAVPVLPELEYGTVARCIVGLVALAGLWWYGAACRVAALRAQLKLLFPVDLAQASWVDLSRVDLSAFGCPKGVDTNKPLLWTSQAEALWHELFLEPRGNAFRGQILAGHLALANHTLRFCCRYAATHSVFQCYTLLTRVSCFASARRTVGR